MLDADELKRRLDGARTLRGLTQNQLAELVADDGLGKHDVGRVERGDLYLSKALRRSICSHLRIPEAWLIEDDLDRVLLPSEAERSSIEQKLDTLLERTKHWEQVLINAETRDEITEIAAALAPEARDGEQPGEDAQGKADQGGPR